MEFCGARFCQFILILFGVSKSWHAHSERCTVSNYLRKECDLNTTIMAVKLVKSVFQLAVANDKWAHD